MNQMTGDVSQQTTEEKAQVLLVGGAGYIGRHVAWQLHDVGIPVVILDDLSTGSRDFLPPCEFVEADITEMDAERMNPWIGKIRAVMHFAALTSAPESLERPADYYRINVGGTVRALDLASSLGADIFVFSSTAAVYGEPRELPVCESHPLNPQNPYGDSKVDAEKVVVDYCATNELTGVLLRYFNVAGSDPKLRTGDVRPPSGNLIHELLACIDREDAEFCIYGDDYETPDETARRDFVHVSDIASAHVYVVSHPQLLNGNAHIFNIGYGHAFSVREILDSFQRLVPERFKPEIRIQPRRPGDIAEIWADNAALQQLGWEPKLDDIDLILKHNVDWYLRNVQSDGEAGSIEID
jgi:UDP-glucose 4-epimerase